MEFPFDILKVTLWKNYDDLLINQSFNQSITTAINNTKSYNIDHKVQTQFH